MAIDRGGVATSSTGSAASTVVIGDWNRDGSLDLAGSFPVHDLVDLGIEVPEGPYTTLAGFLLEELGHIPARGEHVQVPGWRLTATQVTQTAILRVHAARWLDETTE